jgi:hypothetical protein
MVDKYSGLVVVLMVLVVVYVTWLVDIRYRHCYNSDCRAILTEWFYLIEYVR